MKRQKPEALPKHDQEPLEDADPEFDDESDFEGFGRSKTECICPMCGRIHAMKIRWIGRGVPRKFCQHCRERSTPLDEED
jgi:transposase-like protein